MVWRMQDFATANVLASYIRDTPTRDLVQLILQCPFILNYDERIQVSERTPESLSEPN